ncbi:MAG: alpha-2-macroglobulin, partial [Candidatus Rokuibacteriota bacterium]
MRSLRVMRGWLVTAVRVLRLLPAMLVGRVSWTPPRWLAWLGARVVAASRSAAAHPRLSIALAIGLVLVSGGGYWAYAWWQARPRPLVVQLSVTNPVRTLIEDDKKPTPLVVTFDRPVAPLARIGKEVTSGITISPPLTGTWRWASEKRLELIPQDDWAVGAEYTVTLDKKPLLREVRLAQDHFTFQTPAFAITVTSKQFFQDPTNPALKKAVIDLRFTHPVNTAELE